MPGCPATGWTTLARWAPGGTFSMPSPAFRISMETDEATSWRAPATVSSGYTRATETAVSSPSGKSDPAGRASRTSLAWAISTAMPASTSWRPSRMALSGFTQEMARAASVPGRRSVRVGTASPASLPMAPSGFWRGQATGRSTCTPATAGVVSCRASQSAAVGTRWATS